jgi:hypothetical protein
LSCASSMKLKKGKRRKISGESMVSSGKEIDDLLGYI